MDLVLIYATVLTLRFLLGTLAHHIRVYTESECTQLCFSLKSINILQECNGDFEEYRSQNIYIFFNNNISKKR